MLDDLARNALLGRNTDVAVIGSPLEKGLDDLVDLRKEKTAIITF